MKVFLLLKNFVFYQVYLIFSSVRCSWSYVWLWEFLLNFLYKIFLSFNLILNKFAPNLPLLGRTRMFSSEQTRPGKKYYFQSNLHSKEMKSGRLWQWLLESICLGLYFYLALTYEKVKWGREDDAINEAIAYFKDLLCEITFFQMINFSNDLTGLNDWMSISG